MNYDNGDFYVPTLCICHLCLNLISLNRSLYYYWYSISDWFRGSLQVANEFAQMNFYFNNTSVWKLTRLTHHLGVSRIPIPKYGWYVSAALIGLVNLYRYTSIQAIIAICIVKLNSQSCFSSYDSQQPVFLSEVGKN